MKYTAAIIAFVATVSAQTPSGCSEDFDGTFEISPVNVTGTTKRSLIEAREARLVGRQACTNTPVATLKGGILIDQNKRQGEVVANQQFQFDDILQPDAIYTTGFSICANGSLAVGGSAIFYSCKSGSFSNLYHESQGGQCSEVYIDTQPCSGGQAAQPQPGVSGTATQGGTGSSLTSSSSVATSASSTPATTEAASTPATTEASTPATTLVPTTPATIVAPFPTGNATTPAPSGSGASTVPTTSTPPSSSSPVPFVSGADALAIGGKLFVAVAGIAAFALF